MAYSALTTSETDASSPADTTLWTKVKDNFDDLDAARVTNGDSHDHSGGDGAEIPTGGLAANAVTGAKISKTPTGYTQVIGSGASWTPAAGVYQVTEDGTADIEYQMLYSAAWRGNGGAAMALFLMDGSNMRFYNNGGSGRTMYYYTF